MNIYAYFIRHRNGWGTGYGPRPTNCSRCGAALPVAPDTGASGYGCGKSEPVPADGPKPDKPLAKGESLERSPAVCYKCCAEDDRRSMIETGKATLYLVKREIAPAVHGAGPLMCYFITNWPGSLEFKVGGAVRHSRHNIAGSRTDAWFTGPDGKEWHAVNIGDNQIARCRRLKG
jgi:hypothetical protein